MTNNPIIGPILALQDGFRHLEERATRTETGTRTDGPRRDLYGDLPGMTQAASLSANTYVGCFITDVLPAQGWYRVSFPMGCGATTMPCCKLDEAASPGPYSNRPAGAYAVGTEVVVVVAPNASYGVIIGAVPSCVPLPDNYLHPEIATAAGVTPGTDRCLTAHLSVDSESIVNYGCGAPPDTTIGGTGRLSPLGPGYYADTYMAFVRASTITGVWAFVLDDTVRVSGTNLQIWSDGYSIDGVNDQDATTTVIGTSLFGWESLGFFGPTPIAPVTRSAETVQLSEPHFSSMEPPSEKQIPFRRIVNYAGYLGYGQLQLTQIPPSTQGALRLGESGPITVGADHTAIDGSRSIVTSRSLLLMHAPPWVSPAAKTTAASSTGVVRSADTIVGTGQAIPDLVKDSALKTSTLRVSDQVAQAVVWKPLHAFHYDAGDWNQPQPVAGRTLPNFSELSVNQTISPFSLTTLPVDHRHSLKYVFSTSFIFVAPDGRIVLAGPGGAEIRIGDSIEFYTPADIVMHAARNVVAMAGRHMALRSEDSTELVSALGAVRLKADRDVQVLAGNSGNGTLILEGRGAATELSYENDGDDTRGGGVVVKSAGQVAVLGQSHYYRSQDGSITLDASQGEQDVMIVANATRSWLADGVYEYFGEQGSVEESGYRSRSGAFSPGDLRTSGNMLADDNVFAGKNLYAANGTVATSQAEATDGKVGALLNESLDDVREAIRNTKTAIADLGESGTELYTEAIQTLLYDEGRIGSDTIRTSIGFRFPTSEQYRTQGYQWCEPRWVQLSRLAGQSVQTWVEPDVEGPRGPTQPFPGRETWRSPTSYASLDPRLYVPESGEPLPPGDAYKETGVPDVKFGSIATSLPIM
jgi:hypothetical protein